MSSQSSEWHIYEPFHQILIVRQNELDAVLNLCCHAIQNTCALPDLVDAVAYAKKTPQAEAAPELQRAKELAATAQREVDTGFASVFEMATIVLWGALETAIRDFAALWLEKHSKAKETEAARKIKLRLIDFNSLTTEQLYELVIEQIERDTAAPLKKGVGRFDCLLSAIGISVSVSTEIRNSLLELSEVRNILVHKAGSVDRRLAQSCPWLNVKERDTLRVTRDMYIKYNKAVRGYAALVLRTAGAIETEWLDTKEEDATE